ncbi:MAG: hypothetical protein R3B57_03695 [Phycisphaerales bacterium]
MEQTPAHMILLGVALPALIALVGALLAWGLLCDDKTPAARRPWWVAPPALFLAFASVLGATNSVEASLWPLSAPERKLAIGLVALAAGMVDAISPWRVVRVAARMLGAGAAAWVTAGALHPHTLNTTDLVLLLTLAGVLAAACVWVFVRWESDASLGALALGLACGGAAVVLFLGSSPKTGLQAGLLGAFFVAWGLGAVAVPRATLARGGATTLVVILVGLLTAGQAFSFEPAPWASYVLVLVALAGAGLGGRLGRGRHWLVRTVLVFVTTAAPLGIGVGLALTPPRDQERGDDAGDADGWDWSGGATLSPEDE